MPTPSVVSGSAVGSGSAVVSGARNLTRDTDLAASLEVASSLWAKFMGLMGRASLVPGAGLWLPESNGIHMMFMRFPIDAVFLGAPTAAAGASGVAGASGAAGVREVRPVIAVHRNLRAWTGLVPLVRGAHGVLELPVGTIDASGTVVGDLVLIA